LPFGPFLPVGSGAFTGGTDAHTLLKQIRVQSEKRQLFKELELLIIDEVSMLRADMLDAIDLVLRHFRGKMYLPFGGVQVVFIGDLFQLPPVVVREEWQLLGDYYRSPFFFDAHVMRQVKPLYIELQHIYRQNEPEFIRLLNNVRNNVATAEDLRAINTCLDTSFQPKTEEGYITLTSHNHKADAINKREMDLLSGPSFFFEAEITGTFS
jgi:hypothetical protein